MWESNVHHAAAVLLAAPGSLLERLGAQRAGLLLLLGALGTGVTIGAAGVAWLSDFATHRERLEALEAWRTIHEDTVTGPGLAGMRENRELVDSILGRMRSMESMVWEMWCPRFPGRCEARPLPYPGWQSEGTP